MKTTMRASVALGAALALCALAACDRESRTGANASAAPEASTQVIGVKPADPSKSEPPGVTPVDGPQSTTPKEAESKSMPLEGQPNSHSSVSPDASQKSESVQSSEGRGQSGASGPQSNAGNPQ